MRTRVRSLTGGVGPVAAIGRQCRAVVAPPAPDRLRGLARRRRRPRPRRATRARRPDREGDPGRAAAQHGYPYDAVPATPAIAGAPSINLGALGYVEREFTMTGGAKVYRQSGFWSSNGRWGASVAQTNVPYTTRLLVRYPTSPGQVQRDRRGRVAERHDRRGPGPGLGRAVLRAAGRGLRLRRGDRPDGGHERPEDLGPAAVRRARRQQRRAVLRHLHPGGPGRDRRRARRCSAGSHRRRSSAPATRSRRSGSSPTSTPSNRSPTPSTASSPSVGPSPPRRSAAA